MVVYAAYPRFETRVQREAEALVSNGIEVDVICPSFNEGKDEDEHCGVHIHRVRQKWVRKSGLLGQFGQYLIFLILASLKLIFLNFKHRYDVIQAHNLPDFLVFAAVIPKLTGARVIVDLHDLMPEFYQGRFGKSSRSILNKMILLQEHLSCRFADHVITVTEHWRQSLIKRGVPPEKCSVVMNLADTRVFHEINWKERANGQKGFCLIYHGEMPQRYGLDLILHAVHQLRDQIPGLHCKLIGGGPYLGTLKNIASELDLCPNYVEFIGGVPVEELPPLITVADLAVVPYRNDVFTDSLLPTKLMEYAAMGLPSVVARTTAISYYFDDTMVQFFPPDNLEELTRCIFNLYNDKQRRMQFSQGILKFHQNHNWVQASANYVALVKRLANRAMEVS